MKIFMNPPNLETIKFDALLTKHLRFIDEKGEFARKTCARVQCHLLNQLMPIERSASNFKP